MTVNSFDSRMPERSPSIVAFMAVLNIRHSYAPGAWSPVLNNVIMMVTVLVFWLLPGPSTLDPSSMTTPQILVMGIGTTLGIAAQALVLMVAYLGLESLIAASARPLGADEPTLRERWKEAAVRLVLDGVAAH